MPLDTPLALTDRLFFDTLDRAAADSVLRDAVAGAEDGELFLEYRESESISLDDGRIRAAGFDASRGFGLRAVLGEAAGYAHAGEVSEAALKRAAETVKAVRQGRSGSLDVGPRRPMRGSTTTPTRWRRWISRPRPRCSAPSTPMRGGVMRACAR